jgi:arylsulfatase A-like enzyme
MQMVCRRTAIAIVLLASLLASPSKAEGARRPNILLIVFEDMSPHNGAYGDPVAQTPVLDDFARQSVLYEMAFTAAGA